MAGDRLLNPMTTTARDSIDLDTLLHSDYAVISASTSFAKRISDSCQPR
jgi:hypothetical protein